MRITTGKGSKYLVFLLMLAIAIPTVHAYGYIGISPIDKGIQMISGLFNIPSLEQDGWVREGFMKLMIFLVLFAVSNAGLKKIKGIFDNKVSGIVSFAFSAIGVFMMPRDWLNATGGTIIAIMSSFIFILVFIGGAWLAMFKLRASDKDDHLGWVKNLLGLMLLLFLLFLIDVWATMTHLPPMVPALLFFRQDWIEKMMGKR